MTRIASFTQSQTLIGYALGRQSQVGNLEQQISSGKKYQEYRGYGPDISILISFRSLKTRVDSYVTTDKQLSTRLDQQDLHLTAINNAAENTKKSILGALALSDGTGFDLDINSQFQSVVNQLNSQYNDQYLFSGSRTDIKPVTVTDLNALSALPSIANAFANDTNKPQTRVADGQDVTHGILASDVATPLFQVLKDINDYAIDPLTGPLTGPITPAKRNFLTTKLTELQTAINTINTYQQQNGVNKKSVDSILADHEERFNSLTKFISDIEDVDQVHAISRLQSDRIALEASYRVLSQVDQISLIKYL